ncbi:type II secretion system minor pseudopilin GspK [Eleftheria terrae]|uniref:type II secretion system minor pseudopilin GspK n=1 Tax=Eleftheria terrae TaxID=1597781 RepID=UPI00263B2E0C|nr:type II secretion system minor pseudopilin GspK [Eleftheria terrae]WKB54914.1 type II secretion system minor pseudopilin GspK [Eleftheria terrae]
MNAPQRPRRGAALLTAMIIVTLVATLASAMYWRQWRSVQIEVAERSRSQSSWILTGALSWSRLILAEDGRARGDKTDHLSEPWAVPLAEARLSTFLAADNANAEDGPEAFLAGQITDAQSRFNLRNLVSEGEKDGAADIAALGRLCEQLNIDSSVAGTLATAIRAAAPATSASAPVTESAEAPLLPPSADQLHWLGIDPKAAKRLAPYVVLLPKRTPVNLNTAPREVLAAVLGGIDPGLGDRLIQIRQRAPFKSVPDAFKEAGATAPQDVSGFDVRSSYFEVRGRMRIEDKVVEERSLVMRNGNQTSVIQRDRASFTQGAALTP